MDVKILDFNKRTEVSKVRIKGHKVITVYPQDWRGAHWRTVAERDEIIKAAAVRRLVGYGSAVIRSQIDG